MLLTSTAILLSLLVGMASYHLARVTIATRRLAAGEQVSEEGIEEDAAKENHHFFGYAISALAMALLTRLTFDLVTPMGWTDHYALILNAAILLFLATGLTLSWIDIELHILPTNIIYWGGGATLALLIAAAATNGGWSLLIPMAIGGFFYLVFYGLIWFWRPNDFGFGDVRLSFFVGAFLGFLSPDAAFVGFAAAWILALAGICIAAVFGMISSKTQIAFGPWMILGAVVGLFWGGPIVAMVNP